MLDLNSRSQLSDRINFMVDKAINDNAEQPRTYLGCSAIGGTCERAVQADWIAAEHARTGQGNVPQENIPARTRRIFIRGHVLESYIARWVRESGLMLVTEQNGQQFPVSLAGDRLLGHVDGIIFHWRGESESPIPLPALWECKVLAHKWWSELQKKHVRISHPKYYIQVQLYMAGLGLKQCLFTACDADSMELYHELISYDGGEALQKMTERLDRIERASSMGEWLPRAGRSPAEVQCKMCRWKFECWDKEHELF